MNFPSLAYANPELARYARTYLSFRRVLLISSLTFAVILFFTIMAWVNSIAIETGLQVRNFGQTLQAFSQVGLFASLFVIGPAMTAMSFIQEKIRDTAIFQQMSLLPAHQLVAGKFVGSGLASYLVALLFLPVFLISGSLHSDLAREAIPIFLVLLVGGLSWQAVALYLSAVVAGNNERQMRGGLFLGPLVGGAGIVVASFTRALATNPGDQLHFYGLSLPWFMTPLLVLGFLGVWAFVGTVRHVKAGQLIPLSPRTVWLFFLAGELLLCGFLWGRAGYKHWYGTSLADRLAWYVFFSFLMLATLAAGSALNRGQLREWWSAVRDPHHLLRQVELKNRLKTFLIALGLAEAGLLALWLSYHTNRVADFVGMSPFSKFLPLAVGFALMVLAVAAFIQYCALCRFRWQGGAGLAFVAAFYFVSFIGLSLADAKRGAVMALNPALQVMSVYERDAVMEMTDELYFREGELNKYNVDNYYSTKSIPLSEIEVRSRVLSGLAAQGLAAFLCCGLAYHKWRRLRAEAA